MEKVRRFCPLILSLLLLFSLLAPNIPLAHAADRVYYPIDMTGDVLSSRIPQAVSGGCAVASMATIEAYLYNATSDQEKDTVYSELIGANGDDNYAYWSNVGYKTSQDSIDWEKVYAQLAQGYPCIIHRPANGSQSQHWSVVAGYQGSSSQLEPDSFLVVEVNEKSGAAIQTVKEWRGATQVDRYSWRSDGLPITSLPGIHFTFNHPPVIKEYGISHSVSGYITSSENLTAVEVRVISLSSGKALYSKDLKPNAKTYALSSLDKEMKYSSWPEGTYYFTVFAENASGNRQMYGYYFEISAQYPNEIPEPLYTVSFDSNGGSGAMTPLEYSLGQNFTLPACSMTHTGGTFQGWHLRRNDGKWFAADCTWLTEEEIAAGGSPKYLFEDSFHGTLDAWWIWDALMLPAYTFVAQWPAVEQEEPELSHVYRISGSTRYDTAFSVADALKTRLGIPRFDTVLIASGTGFADALSGSYLAAVKNAPILLTNGRNTDALNRYLDQNLTADGTVYILGGTSAVPQDVQDGLADGKRTLIRLAGADRYLTNLAILKEAGIGNQEILITTGGNYADSVAASAVGLPIMLVNSYTNELTADQLDFLQRANTKVLTVIGGTAAVSGQIESQLKAFADVRRISGNTREETSVEIAHAYFTNPGAVCVAFSRDFPDALCGGPFAHILDVPILLVNAGNENAAAEYISGSGINTGFVLGGAAALPDGIVRTVFSLNPNEEIQIY